MEYRNEQEDPYVYEDTGVLKNFFDIRDADRLQRVETEFTYARLAYLQLHPVEGKFDLAHLQSIHRYIFQDVYPWAGQLRIGNLSINGHRFANHDCIESYGRAMLLSLERERSIWKPSDIHERLAHYLGELNALHPFREGNGRTQREFIGQLARQHGIKINWHQMSQESMILASIASCKGDDLPMVELIGQNIDPCAPEIA